MFLNRFSELAAVIAQCSYQTQRREVEQEEALRLTYALMHQTQEREGVTYFIGNGGSAGIASHFCNDFLKALELPAAVISDANLLTCFGNDYGYEFVFSKPLEILLKPQDLLIAISSSGNSANILNAVEVAHRKEAKVITFSGFQASNKLRSLGHVNFWLDVCDYGLVETGHFFLLHTIVDLWKNAVHAYADLAREDQAITRN